MRRADPVISIGFLGGTSCASVTQTVDVMSNAPRFTVPVNLERRRWI